MVYLKNKIPLVRKEKGLTITDLHEQIIVAAINGKAQRISYPSLHAIARDDAADQPLPGDTRIKTLLSIATVLKVTLDDIVEIVEGPTTT